MLQELVTELNDIGNSFPKQRSEWQNRMPMLDGNWSSVRSYLFSCQIFKNSIPKPDKRCTYCDEVALNSMMFCIAVVAVLLAQGTEVPLYKDTFIANDNEVEQHMKMVYVETGSQEYQSDKMCGSSYWLGLSRNQVLQSFQRRSSTTIVHQIEEYFRLCQELEAMPFLEEFSRKIDEASSIISDTSKKRIKICKSISSSKKSLDASVDKYNVVLKLTSPCEPQLDKADVAAGKFAWQRDSVERVIPHWLKKQIVDRNVIIKRCKEELQLSLGEMKAYCLYYKNKLNAVKDDVVSIDTYISDSQTTSERVWGLRCLKLSGIALYKRKLGDCADLFKKALGSQLIALSSNEEADESDDSSEEDDQYIDDNDKLDTVLIN
eukprot:gene10310-11376_t